MIIGYRNLSQYVLRNSKYFFVFGFFCEKCGVLEDSSNHFYQNLSINSKSRPKNSLRSRGVLGLTL